MNSITINDVSKAVGISPRSLKYLYKKELNSSPAKAVSEARFKEAQRLLSGTTLQVDDIAYECGYRNVRSLFTAFKRELNTTPGEFRKQKPLSD